MKELDLSNNRLKDAGIAILLYPFIRQRLDRAERASTKKVKPSRAPKEKKNEVKPADAGHDHHKLKMKLQKIYFDDNQQTDEALKPVYATLLANP